MAEEVDNGVTLWFQASQLRRSRGRQLGLQLKGGNGGERGGGKEPASVEVKEAVEGEAAAEVEEAEVE